MTARTLTLDRLRTPKSDERPKFAADVPLAIRAHLWIVWLRQVAADRRQAPEGKQVCRISPQGAEELASLLEVLARRP